MALKMRSSKFRHVYGLTYKREQTFENVRITRNTHDSNFCCVNPRFLAIVTESSGGGSFTVLDVNRPGRVDVNSPRVCGHAGAVLDIKWNPFDDCVIASGSEDATVKIWTVPQRGLLGTLTDWSADLHGHSRRVAYVDWHPTAANVLMSVGLDYKIMVWNVEQAEPITALAGHRDTIYSASWGRDGALIASTNKDRKIRVLDPRSAQVAIESEGHESAKASKLVFATENHLFTTGFSRISNRQYALWDIRKPGSPLMLVDLDCSSGILLPYYDADTKVVFLAGKGDGSIRYFEIVPEDNAIQFLNTYQSPLPQRGLGMMPKRGVDPHKNELARFFKVHASKNLVEPVSMIVPRKAEGFQPDLFPPTASKIASLSADEWTSGVNRGPILVDLETGAILDKPKTSMSTAVQPQLSALSQTPHITTYKAVSRNQRPPPQRAVSSSSLLAAASLPTPQENPSFQYPATHPANNFSAIYQPEAQHQQRPSNPVPLSSSVADPASLRQSGSALYPQSATAKAFNSAQAIFNQSSSPLSSSSSSSSVRPHQVLGAATYQGRPAAAEGLSTMPALASALSGSQGWSNGRPGELASIKNIRSLSAKPAEEDTDSDSPVSTVSSISIGSLSSQGQGRPASRSMGSTVSLVSPPPPSPSSVLPGIHSNGVNGTGLPHATSDHLAVPQSLYYPNTPTTASPSPYPHTASPYSPTPSPHSYPRSPSPPYDNVATSLSDDVPAYAAPSTAEAESFVDTTSMPFKAALASFNNAPAPYRKPSSELTAMQGAFRTTTGGFPGAEAVTQTSSHSRDITTRPESIPQSTSSQNKPALAQLKSLFESQSNPTPPPPDLSAPFRRGSDSLVPSALKPRPYSQAEQSKPLPRRWSAERVGGGSSPYHMSPTPAPPSAAATTPPPPLQHQQQQQQQHFVRLHEYVSSSPPAQRRSLPPAPSTTPSASIEGREGSLASHRNSLPSAYERPASGGGVPSSSSSSQRQSYPSSLYSKSSANPKHWLQEAYGEKDRGSAFPFSVPDTKRSVFGGLKEEIVPSNKKRESPQTSFSPEIDRGFSASFVSSPSNVLGGGRSPAFKSPPIPAVSDRNPSSADCLERGKSKAYQSVPFFPPARNSPDATVKACSDLGAGVGHGKASAGKVGGSCWISSGSYKQSAGGIMGVAAPSLGGGGKEGVGSKTVASAVDRDSRGETESAAAAPAGRGRKSRLYQRAHTIGGDIADHVSAVRMAAEISSSSRPRDDSSVGRNAIHIRKVWSPPASAVASPSRGALGVSTAPAGLVASPTTDPELKKAYFRQLEEIRSLQEQLQLKDRRIAQLEAELSLVRDHEDDLKPGESNC